MDGHRTGPRDTDSDPPAHRHLPSKWHPALHYADLEYTDDYVNAYARFVAETICENGKAELLDLSGTVTSSELRPAVEQMTKEWLRNRSDDILRELAV